MRYTSKTGGYLLVSGRLPARCARGVPRPHPRGFNEGRFKKPLKVVVVVHTTPGVFQGVPLAGTGLFRLRVRTPNHPKSTPCQIIDTHEEAPATEPTGSRPKYPVPDNGHP